MTEEVVVGRTHKILVEEFELTEPDLTAEANLYADLGLDSLDSVDLVVALEKEFGFKVNRAVDEEKIRQVRSLRDLYAFVHEKIQAAVPGAPAAQAGGHSACGPTRIR